MTSITALALVASSSILAASAEDAAPRPRPAEPLCSNSPSILNHNDRLDSFDRQHGGKDHRLYFRLQGSEPCSENECKLDIVRKTLGPGGSDAVAGSVDLTGRHVRYCVYGVSSVKSRRNPDVLPAIRKKQGECPNTYLHSYSEIEMNNPKGAYSRQVLDIRYLYRPTTTSIDLDYCETSDPWVKDSPALRRTWGVPLGDGSIVFFAETELPRQRIEGDYLHEYMNGTPAITVFGAER